jgi:tRNA pseudouridine55 synthase
MRRREVPVGPMTSTGFVLNVYKEVPWTSFDVITRVRRILGLRQVGHAGSLDPFACGVLLVAVGRATKLVPYLMDLSKGYRGTFVLGRRTSTGDAMGATLEERTAPAVELAELRRLAAEFVGTIQQVPPMVSALKHEGQRLYDLARQGVEVERAARPVRIDRFEITALDLPRVDFELDCGRGTYVRTLVEDLAARISTVASVESLTRSHVGPYEVGDSCRLISEPCSESSGLAARAIPMAEAVAHLPAVRVESRWIRNLRQGTLPPWNGLTFDSPPRIGATVRLLGPERELLALATLDLLPGPADRPVEQACTLRLDRVF